MNGDQMLALSELAKSPKADTCFVDGQRVDNPFQAALDEIERQRRYLQKISDAGPPPVHGRIGSCAGDATAVLGDIARAALSPERSCATCKDSDHAREAADCWLCADGTNDGWAAASGKGESK